MPRGGFIALARLWPLLAPPYAHLLASFARPLIPWFESSPGTRYLVEGTTIIAQRPVMRQTSEQVSVTRHTLRETSADYPIALLAALILATPGFSFMRRCRVLTLSLALLIFTQFLSLLVNIEYTKLWPTQTALGMVVSTDYSRVKMIFFDWALCLLGVHGQGLLCAAAVLWGHRLTVGTPRASGCGGIGRNDPCPCGSGLKAKRCCGGGEGARIRLLNCQKIAFVVGLVYDFSNAA